VIEVVLIGQLNNRNDRPRGGSDRGVGGGVNVFCARYIPHHYIGRET
jgi:hypothetical protein